MSSFQSCLSSTEYVYLGSINTEAAFIRAHKLNCIFTLYEIGFLVVFWYFILFSKNFSVYIHSSTSIPNLLQVQVKWMIVKSHCRQCALSVILDHIRPIEDYIILHSCCAEFQKGAWIQYGFAMIGLLQQTKLAWLTPPAQKKFSHMHIGSRAVKKNIYKKIITIAVLSFLTS